MVKRRITALPVALLLTVALCGCADNAVSDSMTNQSENSYSAQQDEESKEKTKLTVGYDRIDYPIIYSEGDKLCGYAVDFISAVANKLGYECEFRAIGFNMVEQELGEGTANCVISSSFADYYAADSVTTVDILENCCVFAVPTDSEINSFSEAGSHIGVKYDSYSETVLKTIEFEDMIMIQTIPAVEEKIEDYGDNDFPIFISKAAVMHSIKNGADFRTLPEEYGSYKAGLLISDFDGELSAKLKSVALSEISDGNVYKSWFTKD